MSNTLENRIHDEIHLQACQAYSHGWNDHVGGKEYNEAVVTKAQVDEIERYASVYDITIKFIRSHGDTVGLYPVVANQCKCEGATHE